jgi:hypothetical protein
MSNMSYCRFRNTLADLNDCLATLEAISALAGNPDTIEERYAEANARLESFAAELPDGCTDADRTKLNAWAEYVRKLDALRLSADERQALRDLVDRCTEISEGFSNWVE